MESIMNNNNLEDPKMSSPERNNNNSSCEEIVQQNSQLQVPPPINISTDIHENVLPKSSSRSDTHSMTSKPSHSPRTDEGTRSSTDSDVHSVTMTVTIAQAVPTDESIDSLLTVDNSKKKTPDAPRAQGYYHLEYALMDNDNEVVKTDVVSYGHAAKLFLERQDPRVIKTWQAGDLTWVGWSQSHTLKITNDVLLRLYKHSLEVKIWDSKDKCSTRAKFDRPKAFKLPQPKSGESLDDTSGVRALVLKQSQSFTKMQPKKSSAVRPLPNSLSHKKPSSPLSHRYAGRLSAASVSPGGLKHRSHSVSSRDGDKGLSAGQKRHDVLAAVATHEPKSRHTSRLAQLAEVQATTPRNSPSIKSLSRGTKRRGTKSTRSISVTKKKRATVDLPDGVCQVRVRLSTLFTGSKTATGRLDLPVPGIEDMFVSITVDGPLMSDAQKRIFNPMFITVKSVNNMPSTPLSYQKLQAICKPVYSKYKFFTNEDFHQSINKQQRKDIYWDDVNIALLGNKNRARLFEYLRGPGLEIEIHDRDRVVQEHVGVPTIFGDDLEDEKISNVGTVTSRRTVHNAFKGREEPWDPFGVARVNLSDLLLGSKYISVTVPILRCSNPDVLGNEIAPGRKVVGVPGAVDGPVDVPLPAGDYIDSGTVLKVEIELAHPLITPEQVLLKETIPHCVVCPFNRLIFKFKYGKARLLPKIQALIAEINAKALRMEHLATHVRDAALATFKLSKEQLRDQDLDLVTGFHLVDGEMQLLVLEGLRDRAIGYIWDNLDHPYDPDMTVLYNSDLQFTDRMYLNLDLDIHCIKLHEPLSLIIQHPLLYIRDMVPKACFVALQKIYDMVGMRFMEDIVRNELFPSSDAVMSLSKEFGVPITAEDFAEMKVEEENKPTVVPPAEVKGPKVKESRRHIPVEQFNPFFEDAISRRLLNCYSRDFPKENKCAVQLRSLKNHITNDRRRATALSAPINIAHNYSSQNLNSSNMAVLEMRKYLSQFPTQRFTYNQLYSHSMTMIPAEGSCDLTALRASCDVAHVSDWSYPGASTSNMDNIHNMKPEHPRLDELKEPWVENMLHASTLQPTLSRDILPWEERGTDMDIVKQPMSVFGREPITIMSSGIHLKAEKDDEKRIDYEKWMSKLVVDDSSFYVHRLLPESEMKTRGRNGSNQLDRIKGILKDTPSKLSLKRSGMSLKPLPSLSVVNYPDLEKDAKFSVIPIGDEKCQGYQPGPYEDIGCNMEENWLPTFDYTHNKFVARNGSDFVHIAKNHAKYVGRPVREITQEERDTHLFHDVSRSPYVTDVPLPPIVVEKSYPPFDAVTEHNLLQIEA